MRCREVQQKLDLFVGEELASSLQDRIAAHVSGCGRCRQELARLRKLEGLLAWAPCPPVPEGFAEKAVERARSEAMPGHAGFSAGRRLGERLGRRVQIAAGTAAALAGGLLLGSYLGSETWGEAPPAAVQRADPLAGSGLGQLVEPADDSLAHAYLALTTGGDD